MNELSALVMNDAEMLYYLRSNPNYVKELYRNPQAIPNFVDEYKVMMKKTWGDNVERIGQMATMAQMFI